MSSDSPGTGGTDNPGLRRLVRALRKGAAPLTAQESDQGFRGGHERGYLPRRDVPDLVHFVIFRLADCFPAALFEEWRVLREVEDDQDRRRHLDASLDRGRGDCVLRQPRMAALVEEALRIRHAMDYELLAWVIMPHHVHVPVRLAQLPMTKVIARWKGYPAHKANRMLTQTGAFWAPDCWDTFMRDAGPVARSRRWIENNLVKAFLAHLPEVWPWGSARFRGADGQLNL